MVGHFIALVIYPGVRPMTKEEELRRPIAVWSKEKRRRWCSCHALNVGDSKDEEEWGLLFLMLMPLLKFIAR